MNSTGRFLPHRQGDDNCRPMTVLHRIGSTLPERMRLNAAALRALTDPASPVRHLPRGALRALADDLEAWAEEYQAEAEAMGPKPQPWDVPAPARRSAA